MRQTAMRRAEINVRSIWLVPAILFASAFLVAAPSANAQQCDPSETHKLLASDGAGGDFFGNSVAITPDGIGAIVGAWGDDDNGTNSGSAYILDTATGKQLFKLLPDDGAEREFFGRSVGIRDNTAIVGADTDDDNGVSSGSVYFFDLTTGRQIAKLLPSDGAAHDHFGISVAISGAIAIVGAQFDDDNGTNSGSAYLVDTTAGWKLFKILPGDGAAFDWFGTSVAISGATAIVGAYGDDDNGLFSGSAYLFDTTTGRQIAKLLPADGAANDGFGRSVAISPDGIGAIVGAAGDDDNGERSGSAYLFDITDPANPTQIAKLLPDDGAEGDTFGRSVAISGAIAIVGAFWDDDNGEKSGSAYLFDTTTGQQIAKLLPGDGAAKDWFGWSVAIAGNNAIVGAHLDDDNGTDSGSAYLFDFNCEGPVLTIVGSCPGPMEFQASNVTPDKQVAFLYAFGQGSVTIPAGNPCAGTTLGLNRTVKLGTVVRADANGIATVIANIPAQACGKTFVQALDLTTCKTSNVAAL